MSQHDAIRSLRDLVAAPPVVLVGIIDAIETYGGGYLVTGTTQPEGDAFQARMFFGPVGQGKGDLYPVAVGDEVLVLLPGGDPLRAIALPGGNSSEAKLPSSFTNDKPRLVHPNGKTFLTSEGAAATPVVMEALLPDLLNAMTEILTIFGALGALGITLSFTNTTTLVTNLATLYRSKGVFSE